MRRITALTSLLACIVTLLTSIILYITPQGRVAYWSDWKLWGLTKEQWGALHINLGFLFLIFLFLHIYYNWKPLTLYMKDKARNFKLFTREFNISFVIILFSVLGTYCDLPPFSTIINIGEGFKDRAAVTYGEPPYGHAELSPLKGFAQKMGLDANKALESMHQAGLTVESINQTLKEIAAVNRRTPQQVYEAMKAAQPVEEPEKGLPASPPPGTGNLTLKDLAAQYGLDAPKLVQALRDKNLDCKGTMTIKEIAQANNMGPTDVYDVIKEAVQGVGS
ncbi:MAG: DUF4405 domain-containing protein [Desulfatibacillum sp.]|nr:DUF4405 domain-containing protein [Desulfatibacillum sp.]